MRKHLSILFFLLIFILAACQSKTPASTQLIPTPSREISSPVPGGAAATITSQPAEEGAPPGCTVVSQPDPSDPNAQSLFPPASDTDWSFGPGDAKITLIEYSDFQ